MCQGLEMCVLFVFKQEAFHPMPQYTGSLLVGISSGNRCANGCMNWSTGMCKGGWVEGRIDG